MKTIISLIFLLYVMQFGLHAQCDGGGFVKSYWYEFAATGHSVDHFSNGDILICGVYENSIFGGTDWAAMRVNGTGEVIWAEIYGSNQYEDGTNLTAKVLNDDSFMLAGYVKSSANADRDVMFAHFDSNGQWSWSKEISSGGGQTHTPREITQSPDNRIYICGSTDFGFGSSDAFLIEVDLDGNVLWDKTYGGGSNDHFYGMMVDPSGDIIAVGNNQSATGGSNKAWIARLSDQGVLLDESILSSGSLDTFWSCMLLPDGSIWASGFSEGIGNGSRSCLLVEYDDDLDVNWQKGYISSGTNSITQIAINNDGQKVGGIQGVAIGGTGQTVALVGFDDDGNVEWSYNYSDQAIQTQVVSGIHSMADDHIAAIGSNGDEIVLVVTDPCGNNTCANEFDLDPETTFLDEIGLNSNAGSYTNFSDFDLDQVSINVVSIDVCEDDSCTITADFSINSTACVEEQLTIENLSESNGESLIYFWDFGDGSWSELEDPNLIYDEAGVYVVQLTLSNEDATCIEVYSQEIEVFANYNLPDLPDIVICEGENSLVTLDDVPESYTITWEDSSNGATLNIDEAGIYSVTVDGPCGTQSTEFEVLLVESPFNELQEVYEVCEAFVEVDLGTETILLDGLPTSGIVQLNEGIYDLTAELAGCVYEAQLIVLTSEPIAIPDLEDLMLCEGETETVFISNNDPLVEYVWSNGAIGPEIDISDSGTYTVTGVNSCFEESTSFAVEVVENPFNFPTVYNICEETQLIEISLDNYFINGELESGPIELGTGDYTFSTEISGCQFTEIIQVFSESPVISFELDELVDCAQINSVFNLVECWPCENPVVEFTMGDEGAMIVVSETNSCGTASDSIAIPSFCECHQQIYIPNAFTPDGDGRNEVFGPTIECDLDYYNFMIFSRWGELMFQSTDPNKFWIGNVDHGTHYAPIGVYTYLLQYRLPSDPTVFDVSGSVTLVR